MIRSFTISHLSDLHLTASEKDSRSEPKLLGKLKGMNTVFRKLVKTEPIQNSDLVLVTGDVTDKGDIKAWRVFWNIVTKANLNNRILVVPGNHDMCCLGFRPPSKLNWKADIEKAILGLKLGNQPIRFPWAKTINDEVAIFGLNSNNLGNWSGIDNAVGKLGSKQLIGLENKLEQHRNIPIKFVMLHHSPNIPGVLTSWRRKEKAIIVPKLLELSETHRRQLRQICREHKVRGVLHGHVHVARDRRVDGGLRIIGAAATTEYQSRSRNTKEYEIRTLTIKGKKRRIYKNLYKVIL